MSEDDLIELRRRRFIGLTAGAVAVGLAGCQESGDTPGDTETPDDNGDDADETDDDDLVDRRFTKASTTIEARTAQFNPYNPTGFNPVEAPMMLDFFGVFSPVEQEFKGSLAEDWEFGDDRFTITLREQNWTNGDPFTSEDVRTTMMLERLLDNPIWQLLEDVETPDDRTVEFVLANDGAVNRDYLQYYLFDPNLVIATPTSLYGDFVERYEEAETEDELADIRADLSQFENTDVFTGPFELTTREGTRYLADTVQDHPAGSQLNFAGFEFYNVSGPGEGDVAVQSGQADENNFAGQQAEIDALPDNVKVTQFPWYTGVGYSFNYERDVFTYPEFRKAFAHLCNRTLATRNVGTLAETPFEKPHGMVGEFIDVPQGFIGDAWDDFDDYGVDSVNESEAESLLESAGFSREGDEWLKPDGEPIEEIRITGPEGWSWMRMIETDVESLSNFGLPATTDGVDPSVMRSDVWPQGNFDVVTHEVGGFQQYPAGMYSKLFSAEVGAVFTNPNGNMPAEFEVPMPVGDPDGSLEPFDINEKMGELATAEESEQANELIREIAWFVNQAVPLLPVFDRLGVKIWNVERFDIPDEDHPLMQIVYPEQMLVNFPEESEFGAAE